MKEFRTSNLMELKKLAKSIYDICDKALISRTKLIEQVGTTEYEFQKQQSLSDPESYFHFKLFDKGVSIIRLYSPTGWFRIDEERKDFHFAVRCYGFNPSFKLEQRAYSQYIDYGDFETIKKAMPYFIAACVQITDTQYDIIDPLFKEEYVLIK